MSHTSRSRTAGWWRWWAAFGVAVLSATAGTGVGAARAQTDPPPDIVKTLNEFFASQASADAKETLGWTKLPKPVAAGDPVDDHFPLDPASEGFMPPSGDLTGFAHARTGPLDDTSFDWLFGPDGMLRDGAPRVFYPQTFTIDVSGFRQGMLITILVPREPGAPPDAPGEVFTVAVDAFDSRYPAPPSGTFARINKVWRYDVMSSGADVTYRQFDGTQYGSFQSTTIVLDTCTTFAAAGGPGLAVPRQTLPAGCFIAFFTALQGTETENIEEVRGEIYTNEAGQQAADRSGAGTGEPLPTGDLEPGELGAVPVETDSGGGDGDGDGDGSGTGDGEPDPDAEEEPDPDAAEEPDPDAEAAPAGDGDGGGGSGAAVGLIAGGAAAAAAGGGALYAAKRRKAQREAELKSRGGYQGGPVHDGPTPIDPPDLGPNLQSGGGQEGPESLKRFNPTETNVVDAGDATEPPGDDPTGLA